MNDDMKRGIRLMYALMCEVCPAITLDQNFEVVKNLYEEATARAPEEIASCRNYREIAVKCANWRPNQDCNYALPKRTRSEER